MCIVIGVKSFDLPAIGELMRQKVSLSTICLVSGPFQTLVQWRWMRLSQRFKGLVLLQLLYDRITAIFAYSGLFILNSKNL